MGVVAAGAVAAAVVSAAVVAAVVLTAAAEDKGQPLVGLLVGGWAEMMDLCRQTQFFGNICLLFGILLCVCVFVGIPKRDEYYLAFYLCYKLKKRNTQIKNGHFIMCICVSGQESRGIAIKT